MIPISLTIKGLYSYQEQQTIDFSMLTSAHLFGIFGQVGSGKSTILEALTFALYGKTDRLNLSGDNRNYNMMNLKSNELYIEFIFIANGENDEYMATAHSKRNSKRFDDVKKIDRKAYKKVNSHWIPIEITSLEEIIGLSYENFRRTIIIPQGKFQEFLQLGHADRTQMMKELFNLGKFELYYKTASVEKANNEKKQHLEGQLLQLGEVSTEQVEELKKQLEVNNTALQLNAKELQAIQKKEQQYAYLKQLFDKKEETSEKLKELTNQKDAINKKASKVKEFEYCQLNFSHLVESHNEAIAKLKSLQQTLQKSQKSQENLKQTLKKNEEAIEKLRPKYLNREQYKQEAEDMQKIAEILRMDVKSKKLAGRIEKGEGIRKDNEQKVDKFRLENKMMAEEIKALRHKQPDLSKLSEINQWHTEKRNVEKNLENIKKESLSVQKEWQKTEKELLNIYEKGLFQGMEHPKNPGAAIEYLEEKRKAIEKEILGLDEKISHFSVQEKLREFTHSIEEGKPCPLCGSREHPGVLNIEDVKDSLQNVKNQKKEMELEIKELDNLVKKLAGVSQQLKLLNDSISKTGEKLEDAEKQLSKHLDSFKWENFKNEDELKRAFQEAEKIKKQVEEKEIELEKLQNQLEKTIAENERYSKELDKISQEKADIESRSQLLKSQLAYLKLEDHENEEPGNMAEKAKQQIDEINKIVVEYEALEKQKNEKREKLASMISKIESISSSCEEEKARQITIEAKINSLLKSSGYGSIEQVKEVLSCKFDIGKEKQVIEDFNQKLFAVENRLGAINKEIGEKQYKKEEHQKIFILIEELNAKIKKLNEETGTTRNRIEELSMKIEKRETLKKELNKVLMREEDLKRLKSMFKGSGFVNYVSSVHLQNLCNAANERFYKLTRQKLSLEITADNNFQVRDFMNGGKVRSVKTLSGGQTFQAALSLALALADNIQNKNHDGQNFFFLDEGFGTLDKESLDVVFDTLKSLRKEQRIVGVISHVEEMQQEIETYLQITNDEERGSLVNPSWKA